MTNLQRLIVQISPLQYLGDCQFENDNIEASSVQTWAEVADDEIELCGLDPALGETVLATNVRAALTPGFSHTSL